MVGKMGTVRYTTLPGGSGIGQGSVKMGGCWGRGATVKGSFWLETYFSKRKRRLLKSGERGGGMGSRGTRTIRIKEIK